MEPVDRWDAFWPFVRLFKEDRAAFDAKLNAMDQQEVVDLYQTYEEMIADLKGDDFLPYLEGLSEDAIDDIAYRIVEKGEEHYLRVMDEPELVREPVEVSNPGSDARGAILKLYEKRFGEPLWKRLPRA
ncbi:hypothetical protein [Sorangium sp. So ce385]|uniref:hypothetical protein n=1 Tax=Sorangium sp. So ce385 TaxID=3133308 RepID=UPI003F5CBA6D